jgi:outer membrane protein TolC
MRRQIRSAIVAILVLPVPHAYAQQPALPPQLSLAQAVQRALAENARLLAARDDVEQADLSHRLARSAFGPKLTPTVQGSFGRSEVSGQTYRMDFTQQFLTGTNVRGNLGAFSAQNQLGTFFSSDATVELRQPLLQGFGREATRFGLTQADFRVRDAGRQRVLTEQQVAIDVASAYYGVVAQSLALDVAQNALDRARELLAASRAKLTAGIVSQLDVARAEQFAAEGELQLVDARFGIEDAKDLLRTLLNVDAAYAFSVTPGPLAPDPVLLPGDPVAIALANRVDYRSAAEAVAQAERAVAVARNRQRPQLDLSLLLTRRDTGDTFGSSFGLDDFDLTTFVGFSMPLDRTNEQIAERTTVLDLRQRQRDLETVERRVVQEVRRASRRQDRLQRQLQLTRTGVDFAAQELDVATLRYERGLANNLDMVNAESNLLAARNREINMLADLAVANLEVLAVLGRLDPRADIR